MELIKPGQKVSIYVQKASSLIEMLCIINDIDEDRVTLDLPKYFMRYIELLDVGCKLTAKVFSKIGTIDFNSIIINSPLEGEFTIEIDSNAMKLTPSEDIPVIKAMELLEFTINDKVHSTKTFEIATEFLKFSTSQRFSINDTFECKLILPDEYGIIKFKGIVTHIDPVYDDEVTIAYLGMSEEARQQLLYYMYLYSNDSN